MPAVPSRRPLAVLARLCAGHPKGVLGVWVFIVALLVGCGVGLGAAPRESGGLPGSASGAAATTLYSHGAMTGPAGGPLAPTATVAVSSARTLDDADLGALRHRLAVVVHGRASDVGLRVARGGHTAVLWFSLSDSASPVTLHAADLAARAWAPRGVVAGLISGSKADANADGPGEKIGLGVAALVLVAAFGSVLAAGVPLLAAVVAVGTTLASVRLLALVAPVTPAGPQLATMIGLGVGIDYALLLVTRFREQLTLARDARPRGRWAGALTRDEVRDCAVEASVRAGGAVLVAGLTVAVAVVGLAASGVPDITSLGWTTVVAVGFAVVTALTLAPAMLTLLGERMARRVARHGTLKVTGLRWNRHVGRVTDHPVRWTLGSLVVLGLLTAPLAAVELGEAHPQALVSQKPAFAVVTDTFGPGVLTPATLVVSAAHRIAAPALATVDAAVDRTSGVIGTGRVWRSADGLVVAQELLVRAGPGEPSANTTVNILRDSTFAGTSIASAGVHLALTGATAGQADLADRVVARLPLFAGVVLLACLLVLACAFRSIVVPVKAVAVTMLSVGASSGVVVCVVQWGWLRSVIGLHSTQPISAYIPMFLIAIVLGLSMDYEVFLVSRIREHYLVGGGNRAAVVRGTAGTAKTITAAAAIMVSVFLAFTLSPSPAVKIMGLGLATAVALDATIVRMVLVPASMAWMGKLNWWMPRWLDRVLPRLNVAH